MADDRLQFSVDFTNQRKLFEEFKQFVDDPENETDGNKFIRFAIRKELARRKRTQLRLQRVVIRTEAT